MNSPEFRPGPSTHEPLQILPYSPHLIQCSFKAICKEKKRRTSLKLSCLGDLGFGSFGMMNALNVLVKLTAIATFSLLIDGPISLCFAGNLSFSFSYRSSHFLRFVKIISHYEKVLKGIFWLLGLLHSLNFLERLF